MVNARPYNLLCSHVVLFVSGSGDNISHTDGLVNLCACLSENECEFFLADASVVSYLALLCVNFVDEFKLEFKYFSLDILSMFKWYDKKLKVQIMGFWKYLQKLILLTYVFYSPDESNRLQNVVWNLNKSDVNKGGINNGKQK